VGDLLTGAAHPYTRALVGAVPTMATALDADLVTIPGRPPEPGEQPAGCPFAPRCERARDRCRSAVPELVGNAGGRRVACWYPVTAAAEAAAAAESTQTEAAS